MLEPLTTLCMALVGMHPGNVKVSAATTIAPDPEWAPETISFYRPQPVRVPLCRVEGTIEGNIGFELWLPTDWNGRLLGAGVGGDAGVFNYADMSRRVGEGFATVTTDSGHKQGQARWMADPKARVDYEHRAVHLTAVAAKQLAVAFYGKPADHSYYLGCSGGGRQALKEMQNYPGDYDGVVAGAPGPYMPLQSVRMMWFSLQQKRDPAGALRDEDWALYERRVTAQCDSLDGVIDGVIENPMRCSFKPATLACAPGHTQDCLTPARVAMLERIVAPMPDEAGTPMDNGLFPGVRTRPGPPSPLLRAMWADGVHDDADWNEESFSRSGDLAAANRAMPELRADKTAIGGFLRRGGKAILYQGWADPSTNAGPTIDYYAALARANGGYAKLDRSVRLFMVPGMYHCSGGPGAASFGGSGHPTAPGDPERDILWSLIRWVERGRAPERIEATRLEGTTVRFTRALCPFPASARYDGRGPTEKASSYACAPHPLLKK
ncbi:tannase/feruloyl esterase family alpha/beta hydrolase [Sphingomonas sp. HF-S4]|uniref:Tannase/feruloyl esterase family alpha/beta hydrolase n=1 Tax=Sphingomonas agrestis TaxID=3080540 RepID=A0ABU3Y6U4_9SPHN|nr:tannase/feruloyl esterase family alpha/beta hydrolase [Sphingomonas sp. HF-S4]MDV3457110.1 tannase/feruloyl esterase family alpha/beta hydrolase [Sphingomonas sp. HF-S4]